MNTKLKFSWAHIIAFLAIIFISYITFVGITYLTDGSFYVATLGMLVIDALLLLFFIGAQAMKGTDSKFATCIKKERFFVFGSPFVFAILMAPYTHFWTVHSHNDEIVEKFRNAIESSKQLFDDYENYSNERIANYTNMLERGISLRDIRHNDFLSCGFETGKENVQKDNMVKTLRLQLLSDNYSLLKNEAEEWINSSSMGASTWNVFLLGNTKQISDAIGNWQNQLTEFTKKKAANEEQLGNVVKVFTEESQSVEQAKNGLHELTEQYTSWTAPNMMSVISAILLYFCLILPYIMQDRHTKSMQRLLGLEGDRKPSIMAEPKSKQKHRANVNNDDIIIDVKPTSNGGNDEYNGYESFTL